MQLPGTTKAFKLAPTPDAPPPSYPLPPAVIYPLFSGFRINFNSIHLLSAGKFSTTTLGRKTK